MLIVYKVPGSWLVRLGVK